MKHWLKSVIATLSAVALLVVSLPAFSVMAEDGIDTTVTTDIPETSSLTEEPTIVSEEEHKREADVKHFRLSDGRYLAAQYDTPVHYLDENGQWQEYDNRLLDSDTDTVSNQSSDVSVKLSKKAKEKKLIRVRTQGYELAWGYADVFKTDVHILQTETEWEGNRAWTNLTNTSSSVIYENVYTDTDLEIHLSGGAVKENLILKNAAAARSYTLNYEIGDLTVQQQDTQTILLKSAEGEVVYTVSAPYMVDSDGAYSNGLAMSAAVDGKKMTVTLTPDMAWLQDAARVYPVTIDPFTFTDIRPATVESATLLSQDTTAYPRQRLNVGWDASYGKMISLFKPELPPLGPGDIVVQATLQLYQLEYEGAASTQVNVSRIDMPWTEASFLPASGTSVTAKYLYRPSTYDKIDDYVVTDASMTGEPVSLDITRTVQNWYRNPQTPNYGVMLWPQNPDAVANVSFRRETNDAAVHAEQFPTISIIYLNADGLESYRHYHSMAATQRGTAYVNTYTGAAVVTESVFSTNGNRMPLSVSLTYNSSRYNDEFPFGDEETENTKGASVSKGFMFNFQQRIELITDEDLIAAGYKYIYTDGDGTKHYFRQTDNDESTLEWTDETGQGMTLKSANTSETSLYIQFKDGSKLYFFGVTMGGILRWAEDTYGNRIVYTNTREYEDTYGRLITKITDGAGRSVNFTYTVRGNHMRPNTMTDNEGRTYTFGYDSNHRLTSITYPDGAVTRYAYNSDGLLYEIRDSVSKRVTTYVYDVRTRTENGNPVLYHIWTTYLRSQIENGSNILDVEEYYFQDECKGYTYVVDYDTRGTCYYFDKYGRVVGAMDNENGTYHANYAVSTDTQGNAAAHTDTQKENKLASESVSFSHVNNYIVNSGAERDGGYYASRWDSSGINGTSIDNTVAYLGNRSLKIKHDQSGMRFSGHRQEIPTTLAGETVTFSAYVKTQNVSATAEATAGKWGAGLMFEFYDADNAWISTNYIPYFQTGTTDDWVRMSMTHTIPETAARAYVFVILRNATGTAWFDCLQLERGAALNDYNLLENSDFSNNTIWTGSDNLTTGDGILGGQLTINGGGAGSNKYAYQRVDINASGVCFNVYGMMWGTQAARKDGRMCALELCVRYTDDTVKYFTKNFHDSDGTQQAISFTAKPDASKTVAAVSIFFIFKNNVNTAHLLATMLTIDKNGENYTYDDNGNLTAAKDNAFRADEFNFDDATNQLKEYTNTENEKYKYVYDVNNPYQLNVVYSKQRNNGYSYAYDSYGNVTSVTMGKITNEAIDNTLDTLTTSATYTANGNYVSTVTDTLGNETRYTINQHNGLTESVNYVAGGLSRAQTNYTYDETTRLLSGISSTATDNTVGYTYDAKRRLRKISVGGNDYRLNYDAYNNPTTIQWGNSTLTTNTYAEPRKGLVSMVQYGNGAKIHYAYDEYDRLISKSLNNSLPLTIAYNKRGQVSQIHEGIGGYTTDYTYDLVGRLTQSDTYGSRRTRMRYTYDNMDRMKTAVWQIDDESIDTVRTVG